MLLRLTAILAICLSAAFACRAADSGEVVVFITIGQSNADGSAFFDPALDSVARVRFESDPRLLNAKMWYSSTKVVNRESNDLGQRARHVVHSDTIDAPAGWLRLWYRNENSDGRTSMNMIHSYGTYSTGYGTDCAQGRRGMEPQLAMDLVEALPDTELYFIKLGVSGSFISAWADPADDTNWRFFIEDIYRPAITDLLRQGKRPRLAGIWWMQGCADSGSTAEAYAEALQRLVDRLSSTLGFRLPQIYVGTIPAPGESPVNPDGSVAFCPAVREAQQKVADSNPNVILISTAPMPMQYEAPFHGHIHFSHSGQNAIGSTLATHILSNRHSWPLLDN